jgi:hypothetical protein
MALWPRCKSDRKQQGLLSAHRRRCPAGWSAAHLIAGRNADAKRPSEWPSARHPRLDVGDCRRIRRTSLARSGGDGRELFVQEFLVQRRRSTFAPLPGLKFQGGYAQAAYVLTGETRPYNAASAAYGGIVPANPFSLTGGWGAWEIAGRYSTIDLNDRLGAANGVPGGRQTIYTVALNWYVNRNVRFMFDYLHGNVARQVSQTNFGDAGSKFDAFAMRTQVAF